MQWHCAWVKCKVHPGSWHCQNYCDKRKLGKHYLNIMVLPQKMLFSGTKLARNNNIVALQCATLKPFYPLLSPFQTASNVIMLPCNIHCSRLETGQGMASVSLTSHQSISTISLMINLIFWHFQCYAANLKHLCITYQLSTPPITQMTWTLTCSEEP